MQTQVRSALCISTLPIGLFLVMFFAHRTLYMQNNVRTFLTLPSSLTTAPSPAAWQAPPAIQNYDRLGIEDTDEFWWENRDSNRTLYVAPYTGLANTLQSMASAFFISYNENINVKFVFQRDWFGPATWDDLFSFPKVNFNHTFPDGVYDIHNTKVCEDSGVVFNWQHGKDIKWVQNPNGTGEIGCAISCCWREHPFPKTGLWFYRILRPATDIQFWIDSFKHEQDWEEYQWVGVHLRRSDNMGGMNNLANSESQETLKGKMDTSSEGSSYPIETYIFTMYHIQQAFPVHHLNGFQYMKPMKFFLATDNDEAKKLVLNAFPKGKVVVFEHGIPATELRKQNWGMKLAVIDMFLLATCEAFVGTPASTFSEAAHNIGGGLHIEPNFAYKGV